jgi:hypothetical protein
MVSLYSSCLPLSTDSKRESLASLPSPRPGKQIICIAGRLRNFHGPPSHVGNPVFRFRRNRANACRGRRGRGLRNISALCLGCRLPFGIAATLPPSPGSRARRNPPGNDKCDIRIASCRPRRDWKCPFTIRYGRTYFQVIAMKYIRAGARPHVYSLRRLPPGKMTLTIFSSKCRASPPSRERSGSSDSGTGGQNWQLAAFISARRGSSKRKFRLIACGGTRPDHRPVGR